MSDVGFYSCTRSVTVVLSYYKGKVYFIDKLDAEISLPLICVRHDRFCCPHFSKMASKNVIITVPELLPIQMWIC